MRAGMGTRDTHALTAQITELPRLAGLRAALGADFPTPLYLVGGAVRDLLLGREPLDLDLAVEGPLDQLIARLRAGAGAGGQLTGATDSVGAGARLGPAAASVDAHARFGTATVSVGGVRYDIARTRAERYARPGALPEVSAAGIVDDLRRRDFTVNALAVGLTGERAGELICVPHALADLGDSRLRVLHDASFVDDPTRLWRLARYQARLGFQVEPHTRQLAAEALSGGALGTLSGARIGNELRLALAEADPLSTLNAAAALGLGFAVDGALARRALSALPAECDREMVLLSLALLDSCAERLRAQLEELEFTAAQRDLVAQAASGARELGARVSAARSGSQIAAAVGTASLEALAVAGAVTPSEPLHRWLGELRFRRLEIGGDDLIAAGIQPGPGLGRGLAAARDALLDDQAPDREAQLAVALAAAR